MLGIGCRNRQVPQFTSVKHVHTQLVIRHSIYQSSLAVRYFFMRNRWSIPRSRTSPMSSPSTS
jgi:hypothetical protein